MQAALAPGEATVFRRPARAGRGVPGGSGGDPPRGDEGADGLIGIARLRGPATLRDPEGPEHGRGHRLPAPHAPLGRVELGRDPRATAAHVHIAPSWGGAGRQRFFAVRSRGVGRGTNLLDGSRGPVTQRPLIK